MKNKCEEKTLILPDGKISYKKYILVRVTIGYAAVPNKPQNFSKVKQDLFLDYIKVNELLGSSSVFYAVTQ